MRPRSCPRILVAITLCLPLSRAAVTQQPAPAPASPARGIAPADNLVVDGIPPIPTSLAADVRRYTESRGASLSNWHPVDREILIGTRFGNTGQLHRVRMPGGARTQLTFFEEPVGGGSYEPKAGRYIVFGRDVGGNEFVQLYRYDVANGAVTLLTDGGRSQNGGVRWSNAGDRIAFTSTRRNGADRDVWTMDPANPRDTRMLVEVKGGGWGIQDWSPDDKQLVLVEYVSVNQSHLWLVDAATGAKTRLTPEGRDSVAWSGSEFAKDGKGLYLTTDQGSEFARLAYFELSSRRVTPLTADIPWDVDDFELSPDGKTIAFVANEAGVSKLYVLDAGTRRYRPVSNAPAGQAFGLRWHPRGQHLGFTVNSARSTSDVYSLDTQTGEVTRWTESELGGLAAAELAEPTLIRWRSFDGLEISGFLYRPPARFTGKRPVIISIHGGPEGQFQPGFLGRSNFYLNELGVALIYPNVRGSTGYGKAFVKRDNGMKREDSVKDIGALLDWIAQQSDLDASKVMVTGGSYGGYMTLAVATLYNDRIACALDVVGVSNFITFLQNTESYRRDLRRAEYGDEREPAMRAFFERIAPVNRAGNITKPLFVVQGGNDPRVPLTESEQMVARVKQNGGPVWYLMARDEGHGFRKKGNQDFQFYATVLFVRRFLLGEPEVRATR